MKIWKLNKFKISIFTAITLLALLSLYSKDIKSEELQHIPSNSEIKSTYEEAKETKQAKANNGVVNIQIEGQGVLYFRAGEPKPYKSVINGKAQLEN